MELNDISGATIDCSMKIHKALGPGLLESTYQRVLSYELRKIGLLSNFDSTLLKEDLHRIVNKLPE